MTLKTTKMDVWAAEIDDRPGGLALKLRAIANHGAALDCVLARRESGKPGKGVVFVTPLAGKEALDNVTDLGLRRATHMATLKIEGEDHPGMGAEITQTIGEAGVNLHGLTAAVVGHKFVCFASFDSTAELEKAEKAVHKPDTRRFEKLRKVLHRAVEETPVPS